MTIEAPLDVFLRRVTTDWLPTYCAHPKRQYSPIGFNPESIRIDEFDARLCMLAIDSGIVEDVDHGRFRAAQGKATEPLFWEGSRAINPRPITFWHEPAITFGALARLHFEHGWPIELLGNQPTSWAFDLSAHEPADLSQYRILGEVKKTQREAESLIADLLHASDKQSTDGLRQNSAKKWQGLLRDKPPVLWIIGPAKFSAVFRCDYPTSNVAHIQATTTASLRFSEE